MAYYDRDLLNEGYGPDDIEDPPCDLPTEVVITIYRDEVCSDGETHTCRTWQSWPLFQEKAARRWLAYYRRKYGERNVSIDYE